MSTQGSAGFRYTPSGGSLTLLQARLLFREGLYGLAETRYQSVALDQRTIDVVTIEGGAEEIGVTIRFIGHSFALLHMLKHGARGVTLNYYPDLNGADFYPLRLMSAGRVVAIRMDRQRFGYGEWEVAATLRRTDGGSLDALISQNGIVNPGFEAGSLAPHFTVNSGGAWDVASVSPRSGAFHARYNPTGQSGIAELRLNGDVANQAGHYAVIPGLPVYCEGYVQADSAGPANDVEMLFDWRDINGANISPTSAGSPVTPTTSYSRFSHGASAPAAAVYLVVRNRVAVGGNANNLYFDDFRLRKGPAPS